MSQILPCRKVARGGKLGDSLGTRLQFYTHIRGINTLDALTPALIPHLHSLPPLPPHTPSSPLSPPLPPTHTPQLINFKFVPLAHQLNFVLVVSVLWATFLSWSTGEAEKRRKREEEEKRGKPPENTTTEG